MQVSTTEWLTLLRGAGLITNPKKNPMADMLPELSWNLLFCLEVLQQLCCTRSPIDLDVDELMC